MLSINLVEVTAVYLTGVVNSFMESGLSHNHIFIDFLFKRA